MNTIKPYSHRFVVKCNKCNTILESKSKDDYSYCVCGNLTIGGGPNRYTKYIGSIQPDLIEDVSHLYEYDDNPIENF